MNPKYPVDLAQVTSPGSADNKYAGVPVLDARSDPAPFPAALIRLRFQDAGPPAGLAAPNLETAPAKGWKLPPPEDLRRDIRRISSETCSVCNYSIAEAEAPHRHVPKNRVALYMNDDLTIARWGRHAAPLYPCWGPPPRWDLLIQDASQADGEPAV